MGVARAHRSEKGFCDLIGIPLQELEALRAPEDGPWLAGATQKNSWGGFFLKEGFKLTLKACEQGSPNSLGMYKMAQMYELGIGTPVDMDRAADWMRRSVRLSDPQSGAQKARDWLAANGGGSIRASCLRCIITLGVLKNAEDK